MSRHPGIAAALAFLVMAVSACSSSGQESTTPEVSDTTITVGSHAALTGTVAVGGEIAPAAKAYFDYVNENGGVHGRKIIFTYRDDAYNPANTVKVVRRLVEQDNVFPISGCTCWDDPANLPYTFGWYPDYVREGKILGEYIKKEFAGKRVAYFYQDDDLGRSGVRGLDKVIPPSAVVARQSYQPGYNRVVDQVRAIDRAKPDVIRSGPIEPYISPPAQPPANGIPSP